MPKTSEIKSKNVHLRDDSEKPKLSEINPKSDQMPKTDLEKPKTSNTNPINSQLLKNDSEKPKQSDINSKNSQIVKNYSVKIFEIFSKFSFSS